MVIAACSKVIETPGSGERALARELPHPPGRTFSTRKRKRVVHPVALGVYRLAAYCIEELCQSANSSHAEEQGFEGYFSFFRQTHTSRRIKRPSRLPEAASLPDQSRLGSLSEYSAPWQIGSARSPHLGLERPLVFLGTLWSGSEYVGQNLSMGFSVEGRGWTARVDCQWELG